MFCVKFYSLCQPDVCFSTSINCCFVDMFLSLCRFPSEKTNKQSKVEVTSAKGPLSYGMSCPLHMDTPAQPTPEIDLVFQ